MQKIAYIFIILSIASCSVFKKQNSGGIILSEKDEFHGDIVEAVKKLNISNQNYFIRKAEIQVISGEKKESFLASIKFIFPDKYLISLRSKSGVEGARVFLTADTILVNNRISRELLYGDPDFIRKKFGISPSAVPVLFGDFVFRSIEDQYNVKCTDGFMKLHSSMMGLPYESVIDCKTLKLNSCIQVSEREEDRVIMNFSRYLEFENSIVPSRIKMTYGSIQVLITIKNIEIPWEGELEFIPGQNYEVIPLK